MSITAYRFISPQTLSAIADLHLVAKTVIDGFMIGMHASPQIGTGMEFNQYRSYEPGDDLRRIDWKMYARSDRYYVRESEVDTSVTIRFLLDASASMQHADRGLSKFDYARFLIASLAYLAHHQGDAIGLLAVNDRSPRSEPARRDHQHLHRFLQTLEETESAGRWPPWQALEPSLLAIQKRELLIVISDLYDETGEIQEALTKLSAMHHEVLLIHLMDQKEIDFDYDGIIAMEDLESGRQVEIAADEIRVRQRQQMQQWLQAWRQRALDAEIAYAMLTIDQPMDFALRQYLNQRMKLR